MIFVTFFEIFRRSSLDERQRIFSPVVLSLVSDGGALHVRVKKRCPLLRPAGYRFLLVAILGMCG